MYNKRFSSFTMITTYLSFLLILSIGYIRDIIHKITFSLFIKKEIHPILTELQSFYSRNCFKRILDCFGFPVKGNPGRIVRIYDRRYSINTGEFELTDKIIPLINFGSYNYLGFGTIDKKVLNKLYRCVDKYPISLSACTRDIGLHEKVSELERLMADFLNQKDCITFSMGYGTNTSNIPALIDPGTLVYSDELNHASIITGIKLSKGIVRVFRHNDMADLEKRLVYDISQGQPITHRSWNKIIVIVEGIYSMEGTILNLKELVRLKKKYKFYIFIDEAHSIGAIGKTGRGICEYHDVDFNEIDILMGTFTKSFAGMGGYIAGSKKLIDYLRFYSDFSRYGEQMTPVVATQIIESLKIIKNTKRGKQKLERLQRNVKLMREGLSKLNLFVLGDNDSPVIPIIISNPGKLCEVSRLCREEGIGIVIVGYPASPVLYGRIRLCMSSAHRRKDINKTLEVLRMASDLLGLRM
ncbi:hypothetical protein P3W45_001261 [Vairimorpha bombi]|jgi:serine palmitoyltransferase